MIDNHSALHQEYIFLYDLFQSNYANISKLQSFFSLLHNNTQVCNKKIVNDLKAITSTDSLNEFNTKFSNQRVCYLLYDQSMRYLKEFDQVIESIVDQLVSPIESFSLDYANIYQDSLDEVQRFTTESLKSTQSLDIAKNKYKTSAAETYEHENKITRADISLEKLTEHNDTLLRLRAQTENYAQLYKYEITKANQINMSNNKKHVELISKIKVNEESRISIIKEAITKYSKILSHYKTLIEQLEDSILCFSNTIDVNSDIEILSKMISEKINNQFGIEVFKEYIPPQLNKDKNKDIDLRNTIVNNAVFSDFEIVDEVNDYSAQYQDKFILEFSKKLMKKEEVSLDEISKIIEMNNQNGTCLFCKCFINQFPLKKEGKVMYYRLPNYDNLLHFATILNCFCLNSSISYSKDELNVIYYSIISLAERVCYSNIETSETIYLCAILSHQNKVYSTQSFWKDLIFFHLKIKLEKSISNIIQMKGFKPKKKDLFDFKKKYNTNIFKASLIDQKSMLETIGLSKELKNYNILPESKLPYIDNFASSDLFQIIKEFIPYLSNFNYPMIHGTKLISELFSAFNIRTDKKGYLTLYLMSWNLTEKKTYLRINSSTTTPHIATKKELQLRIEDNKSYQNKKNQFNSLFNSKTTFSQKAIRILGIISHYLTIKEVFSLVILNKESNRQKKRIMKNYFNKRVDISLNERICLWFSLLNIGHIRKKYNYKLSIGKSKISLEQKYKDIIYFDVQRTAFPTNDKENKITLSSILTAMATSKENIRYCQGMNYITSFVLQLFQYKEEATYYFMLALFDTMDYEQMYFHKLTKLKSYFFFLERLLGIYLPNLNDLFLSIDLNVNYFTPPWFLTLFTNSSPNVNLSDPPIVVLKIWTDFFLSGWKVLLIASLALLKFHEPFIFKIKQEEILTFVINTVSSASLINSSCYEQFEQLLKKYNVTKSLISNLNSEYEIYQQLFDID